MVKMVEEWWWKCDKNVIDYIIRDSLSSLYSRLPEQLRHSFILIVIEIWVTWQITWLVIQKIIWCHKNIKGNIKKMGKMRKDGERISLWWKKRKREKGESKNGKMVGNIVGILGNINGSIRIILYKYNMYSLTFS